MEDYLNNLETKSADGDFDRLDDLEFHFKNSLKISKDRKQRRKGMMLNQPGQLARFQREIGNLG